MERIAVSPTMFFRSGSVLPTSRLRVTYGRSVLLTDLSRFGPGRSPRRIDYLDVARKTPFRENTSFMTPFSALPREGITPCCSIIRDIHHATRASGSAEGFTAQSQPGVLFCRRRCLETQPVPGIDVPRQSYRTSPLSK